MPLDFCLNPKQFSPVEVCGKIPDLAELLSHHGVRVAYLFGSVFENSANPLSDLDLAILPPKELTNWLGYYNNLHSDLCELFQADNIDLVRLDRSPVSLQAIAILKGVSIFDNRETTELAETVLARYADMTSWRRENWEATRQLVRQGITGEINMVNPNRVERFVFLIRDAVRELQWLNLEAIALEEYLADKQTKALSEHYLRIALEATLDLGRHVIVSTGLGSPQEYRDVGKILGERGILPAELGRELAAMPGMQNVLVHLYWDVDYVLLYEIVRERLGTFEKFVQHIFLYIEERLE